MGVSALAEFTLVDSLKKTNNKTDGVLTKGQKLIMSKLHRKRKDVLMQDSQDRLSTMHSLQDTVMVSAATITPSRGLINNAK